MAQYTKNDNETTIVDLIRRRINDAWPLIAKLTAKEIAGAMLAQAKTWKSAGKRDPAAQQPQSAMDGALKATLDIIGPVVREYDARFQVSSFQGAVTGPEGTSVPINNPLFYEKILMASAWLSRWLAVSDLSENHDERSFRRIQSGWSNGRWTFDENAETHKETMGVLLKKLDSSVLVTDPANKSQNLKDHEFVIESTVMTIEEAVRLYGPVLEKKRRMLEKSGKTVKDLTYTERFVGKYYGSDTGAFQSSEPGVIVHTMFDKKWKRHVVILQVPGSENKDNRGGKTDPDWHIVVEEKWKYGCQHIKLDLARTTDCYCGDGIPLILRGPQTIVSIMHSLQLQAAYAQGMVRWIVVEESLKGPEDEAALTSNKMFAIVRMNRAQGAAAPIPLQVNRYDSAAGQLMNDAIMSAQKASAISPILQGEGLSRETGSAASARLQQALIPMDKIGKSDQRRYEAWLSNMVNAVIERFCKTGSNKSVIDVFGERFAGLVAEDAIHPGRLASIADSGPVVVHLQDEQFRPQTPDDKDAFLKEVAVAGHLDLMNPEMVLQRLLQTGRESIAGAAELVHAASMKVQMALSLRTVKVWPGDPHAYIIKLAKQMISCALPRGYDDSQVEALNQLVLDAEEAQFMADAAEAQRKALFNPQTQGPEVSGEPAGVPPSAPMGDPAMAGGQESLPMGEPTVGALVGQAG
ncbi:MAG: hypothetical protein IMZ57_04055 [Acidobacteria bacterium]|nr:hypothetical protein [Acidobacteriota bacterium]